MPHFFKLLKSQYKKVNQNPYLIYYFKPVYIQPEKAPLLVQTVTREVEIKWSKLSLNKPLSKNKRCVVWLGRALTAGVTKFSPAPAGISSPLILERLDSKISWTTSGCTEPEPVYYRGLINALCLYNESCKGLFLTIRKCKIEIYSVTFCIFSGETNTKIKKFPRVC